jgi:hypothetical protein
MAAAAERWWEERGVAISAGEIGLDGRTTEVPQPARPPSGLGVPFRSTVSVSESSVPPLFAFA